MTSPRRTEDQPHDRLTRICDRVTTAIDADPEHQPEDKAIIMLDDGEKGGLVLHGYDNDVDAMADLLTHLKAIFEANGRTLVVAPLGRG